MSLSIQYCNLCGERIPLADLQSGEAFTYRDDTYCAACAVEHRAQIERDPEAEPVAAPPASPAPRRSLPEPSLDVASIGAPTPRATRAAGKRTGGARRPGRGGTPDRQRRRTPAAGGETAGGAASSALLWLIGGVMIALLTVVVVLVVVPPPPPPTEPEPQPTVSTPSSAPETDPAAAQRMARLLALQRWCLENPTRYKEQLERWHQLRRELASSELGPRVERGFAELEEKVARLAEAAFDSRKQQADDLAGQRRYDQAIEVWLRFPDQLLIDRWETRVADALEALRIARREHQARAALAQGEVPRLPGPLLDLSPRPDLKPWRARSGTIATAREGVLSIAARERKALAWLYHAGSPNRWWRDVYLTFELRVLSGKATLVMRTGSNQNEGLGYYLRFDPATSEMALGSWHRVHVVLRGMTCEWWADGAVPLARSTSANLREGAIAVRADPGDRFELRRVQACPLSRGREHDVTRACELHLPPSGKPLRLLGLKGLRQQGNAAWRYEGGVLSYRAAAATRLDTLEATDFRVTFQVSDVKGLRLRYRQTGSVAIAPPGLAPGAWAPVEVIGQMGRVWVRYGNQRALRFFSTPKPGPIGFALPKGGAVRLRNVLIQPLRPTPPAD